MPFYIDKVDETSAWYEYHEEIDGMRLPEGIRLKGPYPNGTFSINLDNCIPEIFIHNERFGHIYPCTVRWEDY